LPTSGALVLLAWDFAQLSRLVALKENDLTLASFLSLLSFLFMSKGMKKPPVVFA